MVKSIRRFGLGRLMYASRISAALTTQHRVARAWKERGTGTINAIV